MRCGSPVGVGRTSKVVLVLGRSTSLQTDNKLEAKNSFYLNIFSSNFTANEAGGGGGAIEASDSNLNIVNSYYTSNSAESSSGGAVYIEQSFLHTSQSYYTNNTAYDGGAIYCSCSDVCTFVSIGNYYMGNSASELGGVMLTSAYKVITTNDYYFDNYAPVSGGTMYHTFGTISISGTSFSYSKATSTGGAITVMYSSLSISETHFKNNTVQEIGGSGGALFCYHSSLTCSNSYFLSNNAFSAGGAISIKAGSFVSTSCHFIDNQALYEGGALHLSPGNVSSINSFYSNNTVSMLEGGGAIYVQIGSVSSNGSSYIGNFGGAIYVKNQGSIFSSGDFYVNNTGSKGGAIHIFSGNVTCTKCLFNNNQAYSGGAIFAWTGTVVFSTSCLYEDNIAIDSGGAIFSNRGVLTSSYTNFTNNYSADLGGAVFVFGVNISSMESNFVDNKADRAGGAICALLSNIYSDSSLYVNNHADEYGGAIYTDSCNSLLMFQHNTDDRLLLANSKSICSENEYRVRSGFDSAKLELSSSTIFTNNTCGLVGGAMISIQVDLCFNRTVPAIVNNNVASYGGGLALLGSMLSVHSPIEIQGNNATLSGGGIFSYKSDISLSLLSSQDVMSIGGNTVLHNGGGIYAVDSYIEITHGIMHFEDNVAIKGAALSLEKNSKIQLLKERKEMFGEYNLKLEFINNSGQYGGAVYISDGSEDNLACDFGSSISNSGLDQSTQECFIQSLLQDTTVSKNNTKTNYINIFFENNTASVSGGAIYGGLLDRCTLNCSAELVTHFPEYQQSTGFDYIRATAQFAGLVDYDNLTLDYHPDKLIDAITSLSVEGLISSEPVQVCFCFENVHNCNYDHPNVFTKKGQLFHLSVVAVDQVGNPINATVISSFVSNNRDLNVDQARQETTTHCTELDYNVYPKGDSKSSELELYAEGPCRDHGISKRILNVTFLPCTCPIGFHPVETKTQCTCDCDPILRPVYITNCSSAYETVLRNSDAWIDYVNTTTETGYIIYPKCPFDYCVNKPVNVNLNVPNGADVQCAFNRSGKLCGACKKNLSLMMGTSRCQQCSHNFLSLIIPFAVAGIALVAFILILNVTVPTGTIHGLIFYANILVASRSIFIPFDTPNFLIIFISWINLDLGIETCFYNGMDSYAKVLLQLAFPTYIILITVMIIIISEYSIRFSTLIGKRDPVATLCTLILLSYSKLIRTIIASLQYTYLKYPDGSHDIVWLYDANVPYLTPNHIPFFVIAIAIIVVGSVYTVLIFFGQWIQRCGNRRFLRCFNNPKYNAFIVKYHAPFNPKQRYWVGLLLLARLFHYLVSAFVPDAAILLSVICIVVGLVLLKLMSTVIMRTSTYNNWFLDALEVSFLLNLEIYAAATYYVGANGGNQIALAATSLGLSFITFLGILTYHFYAFILKGTRAWTTAMQLLQRIVQVCKRRNEYERVPLEEDQEDVDNDNEQDEQMIEMQPPYTDDNNTDPNDLPQYYDPPVIVPAVRYDQPREPALDIIDPITTDDYRQLNQPPAPRPRQVPTSTVIDFIRPRRSEDHLDHQ